MKVVIINRSDIIGGAAIASLRLLNALLSAGVDATMLVVDQSGTNENNNIKKFGSPKLSKYYFIKERLRIFFANGFSRKNLFKVSIANSGFDLSTHPDVISADIIVLNWINQGTMSLDGIAKLSSLGIPIVWTMHDMWECTGICHHAYDCNSYKKDCGQCVFLNSKNNTDLSYHVLREKRNIYSDCNITFVAVSNWLADRCKESTLLSRNKVEMIHNAFPVEEFSATRLRSDGFNNIPNDKKIIIMGAARLDDPIKGFDYLIDATAEIAQKRKDIAEKIHLVLFGNIRDKKLLERIEIPYTYLGAISENKEIAKIYAHGDIVLSTSLFETLGYTIIEGQAAGCVPVSFGNGGQVDIIEHLKSGYIAKYKSAKSIADGIEWAISANIDREYLRNEVTSKFSQSKIANQYITLFNSLQKKN